MGIGSIFEINPQDLCEKKQNYSEFVLKGVRKYKKAYEVYTATAREALLLAIRNVVERDPKIKKTCLMPAYMCDTVFFPFVKEGWTICYYHVDEKLDVNIEDLCDQVNEKHPGMIFIHDYYGRNTWDTNSNLLKSWRAQGICIVEDVTQAYYVSRSKGWEADYIIGSLRKWYAILDGGFLLSDIEITSEELHENRVLVDGKKEVLIEKWNYIHGNSSDLDRTESFLNKNSLLEEWLDRHIVISRISRLSVRMLNDIDETYCEERRKENSSYLKKRLMESHVVVPVSCGVAPLYFPVYTENREQLQRFLCACKIYAPILWPLAKENRECLSSEEKYIYEHLLALPLDYRYGTDEMIYIADMLENYENI